MSGNSNISILPSSTALKFNSTKLVIVLNILAEALELKSIRVISPLSLYITVNISSVSILYSCFVIDLFIINIVSFFTSDWAYDFRIGTALVE